MTPSFPTRRSSDLGPDHRLQDLNRTVLLAARSLDSRTRKLFAQYRRREGQFCQHRGGRTTLERRQRTVRGDAVRSRTRSCIEIGRAHVCTPVTNAHLVCRLLLEKKKYKN